MKNLATPIHCEWSNWEIGDCSAPCGGGTRTKSRTKIINNESSGGKCVGQSQTRESCNTQSCAGKFSNCISLINIEVETYFVLILSMIRTKNLFPFIND